MSASEPEYKIHPLAEKFPAIPPKDFEELKESIRKYGLFEPIVVSKEGYILDGRHRYRALMELERSPSGQIAHFEETVRKSKDLTEEQYIYDSNIHRRHLTDDQRVMLATAFAPFFRKEGEKAKEEGNRNGGKSDPKSGPSKKRDIKSKKANSTVGKVAAKAGVSLHKAEQAIMVEEHAPELSSAVASGEMALKDAAKEAGTRARKRPSPKKPSPGAFPGKRHSKSSSLDYSKGLWPMLAKSTPTRPKRT